MNLFRFIKRVFKDFGQDKAGQLSAAFAYVAIFSIGPLLLVLISVISFVFGEQAAKGELFSQLSGAIGPEAAKTIQNLVASTHQSGANGLALVAGIAGMLLGAAALTTQLQNSFNAILGVVPDPKAGIKRTVYVKLKNIGLIIIGGIAVTASVIISALVSGLGDRIQDQLGTPPIAAEALNTMASLLTFVGLLYLLYRVLPDVKVPRKIVLTTSLVVALLFTLGKIVLAIIIGRNGTASAYGAAASLVTLLLWVYYSGQILFLGAEGIKVYGFDHSISYAPKKYNLKRQTITIDSDKFTGRLVEAFHRGFKKKA